MNLHWDGNGDLRFQVHNKPGQKIKHVGKDSARAPAILAATPKGVLKRLARLTSNLPRLQHKTTDQICPEHAVALHSADLTSEFPTLQEVLDQDEAGKDANEGKKKSKPDKRNICPVIGFSRFWKIPAHRTVA